MVSWDELAVVLKKAKKGQYGCWELYGDGCASPSKARKRKYVPCVGLPINRCHMPTLEKHVPVYIKLRSGLLDLIKSVFFRVRILPRQEKITPIDLALMRRSMCARSPRFIAPRQPVPLLPSFPPVASGPSLKYIGALFLRVSVMQLTPPSSRLPGGTAISLLIQHGRTICTSNRKCMPILFPVCLFTHACFALFCFCRR